MKENFVLCLLLTITSFLEAQIVTIPDVNFKDALVNEPVVDTDGDGTSDSDADLNDDGEIQVSEAESVFTLNVTSYNISNLEGIEAFANLRILNCGFNPLAPLDVTSLTLLEELFVSGSFLTELTVANPNLEWLRCWNNDLTTLDVSQCPNLELLSADTNFLTNIVFGNHPNLVGLDLHDNELTSIDLSNMPNLDNIFLTSNDIVEIDLSSNPNLTIVSIRANDLTSLDISNNPSITLLDCGINDLTSLNLNNNNNEDIGLMRADSNPNLECINVDNEAYANSILCESQSGWCKDETASYSENCVLGIKTFDDIALVMYPNPVQSILNIESDVIFDSIEIYTLGGQLIEQTNMGNIDVSELSSGLYFAMLTVDGVSGIKKFAKS